MNISVEDRPIHGATMVIRFYNCTSQPVLDTTIRVSAVIYTTGSPQYVLNKRLQTLTGDDPQDASYWAFSDSGMPFSVFVPRSSTMTAEEIAHGDCIDLQGAKVKKNRVIIRAIATGTVSDTGQNYVSVYEYPATLRLILGQFQYIGTEMDVKPKDWSGRGNFDGNSEMYVFVYSALVGARLFEEHLGHPLMPRSGPHAVMLKGWARAWIDGRISGSGTLNENSPSPFIASLSIAKRAGSMCNGAVYRILHSDLERKGLAI